MILRTLNHQKRGLSLLIYSLIILFTVVVNSESSRSLGDEITSDLQYSCPTNPWPRLNLFLPLSLQSEDWKDFFFQTFFLYWPIEESRTRVIVALDEEVKGSEEEKRFQHHIQELERDIHNKRIALASSSTGKQMKSSHRRDDEKSEEQSTEKLESIVSVVYSPPSTHYGIDGRDRSQLMLFHADELTNGVDKPEYLGFVDSDTMFMTTISQWDVFSNDNRPVIHGRTGPPTLDFDRNMANAIYWLNVQESTHRMLGLKEVTRCSSYFPMIVKRDHVRGLREYVEHYHNEQKNPENRQSKRSFDEIFQDLLIESIADYSMANILCSYLFHEHRNDYHWHMHYTIPIGATVTTTTVSESESSTDKPTVKVIESIVTWDRHTDPPSNSHMDISDDIYRFSPEIIDKFKLDNALIKKEGGNSKHRLLEQEAIVDWIEEGIGFDTVVEESDVSVENTVSRSLAANEEFFVPAEYTFHKPRIAGHPKYGAYLDLYSTNYANNPYKDEISRRHRLVHGLCLSPDVISHQDEIKDDEMKRLIDLLRQSGGEGEAKFLFAKSQSLVEEINQAENLLAALCKAAVFDKTTVNEVIFEPYYSFEYMDWNTIISKVERLKIQKMRYNHLLYCEADKHFITIYNLELVKGLLLKSNKILNEGLTVYGRIDPSKSYWCRSTGRSNFVFANGSLHALPDWDTAVAMQLTHPDFLNDAVCKITPKGAMIKSVDA